MSKDPAIAAAGAAEYFELLLGDAAAIAATYGSVSAVTFITAVQYLQAQRVRAKFVKEFTALFRTFDVFLTPGFPAPAGEPSDVAQPFRRVFNVCGFPALVLPAGFSTSPAGLPIGLQIAASPFAEATIYAAAAAFESATPWHLKRPAL